MHQTANNDGNSIVLFRKSDVVSAGDDTGPHGVSASSTPRAAAASQTMVDVVEPA